MSSTNSVTSPLLNQSLTFLNPSALDTGNSPHVEVTVASDSYGTFENAEANRPEILVALPLQRSKSGYEIFAEKLNQGTSDAAPIMLHSSLAIILMINNFVYEHSDPTSDPAIGLKANVFIFSFCVACLGFPAIIIKDAKRYVKQKEHAQLEAWRELGTNNEARLVGCGTQIKNALKDTVCWGKLAINVGMISYMIGRMISISNGDIPTQQEIYISMIIGLYYLSGVFYPIFC